VSKKNDLLKARFLVNMRRVGVLAKLGLAKHEGRRTRNDSAVS
jgi:hypothetical protein